MTTDINADCRDSVRPDPEAPNWADMTLADTWADRIRFTSFRGWATFMRSVLGAPKRVQVGDDPALFASIPKYALQEFHNLPNGNYSGRISRGYISGFDVSMLGRVNRVRRAMASQVAHCQSVLDVGTCGGKLAAEAKAAGVPDVWGADVSPYLLKHAATDHPGIRFIQAPAEDLPFRDQRFDAIVVCFLFHEMPPRSVAQALAEFRRLLRPGGQLLIAEPSRRQLDPLTLGSFFRPSGWRHWYFKSLARFVHEPFVMAWHKLNKPELLASAGFTVSDHWDEIPVAFYKATKQG